MSGRVRIYVRQTTAPECALSHLQSRALAVPSRQQASNSATMRASLATLAAFAATAHAFKGTSPFVLFSTSQYVLLCLYRRALPFEECPRTPTNNTRLTQSLQDASVAQIQSSEAVLDAAEQFLSSCPTDVYYIIQQPSVLPSDLSQSAIPNLRAALSSSAIKGKFLVSETRGLKRDDLQRILDSLKTGCGETTISDNGEADTTLSDQISGSRKDGKKFIALRNMEDIAVSKSSSERVIMLNDNGAVLPR